MIKAAVLGSPIAHSLSPLLHRAAYTHLGVSGDYQAIEVKLNELKPFLEKSLAQDYSGFSLTMPLKEEVINIVGDIDPLAREIASANTVVNRDGHWVASSTDLLAFTRLLQGLSFTSVCVIGGGGTARAALGALRAFTENVDVLLRSPERLGALIQAGGRIDVKALEMSSDLSSYDLVISTVPAGVINLQDLVDTQPQGVLLDVLYHPWPTPLAAKWRESGQPVISGRDLLVEQALDQISLMTGNVFDYEQMRKVLYTALLEV